MASRPTVRWNESAGRWMAWVRFPDGARRKVERVDKAAAQRDLDQLLSLRAQALEPPPRRERAASFAQVIDTWLAAGCPIASPTKTSRHAREKSRTTIANARYLLEGQVGPTIGGLGVDGTAPARLEELFAAMAREGYSTSTVDRTWLYLNQACSWAMRQRQIRTNPAADVLLPVARPAKTRKSLTIKQAQALLVDAIPGSTRPAMWLT